MYKNQKVFALAVIVIFLIIFAAVVAGAVYVFRKNAKSNLPLPAPAATLEPSSATKSESEKACGKIPDQNQKDTCYAKIARAEKNPSPCDKIQLQSEKDMCYLDVVRLKHDPLICNKIQEQRIRDGCYLNIASINRDPSVCGKIPDQDQKDTCYLAVVANNQDLSVCDKIQNQESREYCLTNPTLFISKPPNPTLLLSKWKIYINEKQKYFFKYPSEWVFQVTFSSPTASSKPHAIMEEISNRNDYNWNWSVRIAAWDNPSNLSLIDWLKSRNEPGGLISKDMPFVPNTVVGKARIAALQTWTGSTTWDKPSKCVQACPTLDIYFVYKDKGYRVELEGKDAAKKESQEIFKQVISTFEFIN